MTTENDTTAQENALGDYLRLHGARGYTEERAAKKLDQLIEDIGYAGGAEGQVVLHHYLPQLQKHVEDVRSDGRRYQKVWTALEDVKDFERRLLYTGVSVAMSTRRGVNRKGVKTRLDTALDIAHELEQTESGVAARVGDWGIDMLCCLPIFALDEHDVLVLSPTVELEKLLDEAWDAYVARNPFLLPRSTSPEPWTDVWKVVSPEPDWLVRIPLVNRRAPRKAMREALRSVGAANDGIGRKQGEFILRALDTISAQERVAFKINEPVLKVVLQMRPKTPPLPDWLAKWMAKYGEGKMVPQWLLKAEHVDEAPLWLAERSKKAKDWLKKHNQAASWYLDMTMAEMLVNKERVFVDLHWDFRTRQYGVQLFNIQRGDHVRGLFLFADGKEIGADGLFWLTGNVARLADGNVWSENDNKPSRLSRRERCNWTISNMKQVRAIGEAVKRGDAPVRDKDDDTIITLAGIRIDKIDDLTQFLAACHELVRAWDYKDKHGTLKGFITYLPLFFDGSCNGLQHLCAMTRSMDGKKANLVPSEVAEDFYRDVAAKANECFVDRWYVKFNETVKSGKNKGKDKIHLKTFSTEAERDRFAKTIELQAKDVGQNENPVIATGYIDVVIDRAIAKKPVMSYFYGATKGGMTEQVAEALRDQEKPTTGASKIAAAIFEAVKHVAPNAAKVREYLETMAELYADQNKTLIWYTVDGVPVPNLADEPQTVTISSQKNGRRRRLNVAVDNEDDKKVDPKAAKQSATANFIHSTDASHLRMIARQADKEGIPMAAVHDSYAFLAPDAERGNEIIRSQFIALHLAELLYAIRARAEVELPPNVKLPDVPKWGDLDIGEIGQAEFSFH